MILYVVFAPKKLIQKVLKENKVYILSWSELLTLHNKGNKKKDQINDEIFSLQFDTCLNSIKGNPGLRQCIFIISENNIEDIILTNNFNLLEINLWG